MTEARSATAVFAPVSTGALGPCTQSLEGIGMRDFEISFTYRVNDTAAVNNLSNIVTVTGKVKTNLSPIRWRLYIHNYGYISRRLPVFFNKSAVKLCCRLSHNPYRFNDAAGKSHSMTRRLLDQLVAAQGLRLVSDQAMAQPLIFSVITQFSDKDNSVELPLMLFFDRNTFEKILEIIRTYDFLGNQ